MAQTLFMNRRGTEPYARWCERTGEVTPLPTRFGLKPTSFKEPSNHYLKDITQHASTQNDKKHDSAKLSCVGFLS